MTTIYQRLGIDFGARLPIMEVLDWCNKHDVKNADIRLGDSGNEFENFGPQFCQEVRTRARECGVNIGLHTLSAVNVAEIAPYTSEAVDRYLKDYVDIAAGIDAKWIVVHAGYHFTACYQRRKEAGLRRLQSIGSYAKEKDVKLLLENMNPEPQDAEVKYLAQDVEETRYYFENLDPDVFLWSYTVNHAHMLPVGIEGFFDSMRDIAESRLGEVRVADNKGDKEEHLAPGKGTIDFKQMFRLIEATGYGGPYTLAYGTLEQMQEGRSYLAKLAD